MKLQEPSPISEDDLRNFSKALNAANRQEFYETFDHNFHLLFQTAHNASIHSGHCSVAINALCALIGRSKSFDQNSSLSKEKFFCIADILLDRSDGAKSKQLRQLLLAAVNNLPDENDGQRQRFLEPLLETLLGILQGRSDRVKVKPALSILSTLITKKSLSVSTLIDMLPGSKEVDSRSDVQKAPNPNAKMEWLVRLLMYWIQHQASTIAASTAVLTLVKETLMDSNEGLQGIWVTPLIEEMRTAIDSLHNFRSHLLPQLFAMDLANYRACLSALGFEAALQDSNVTPQPDEQASTLNEIDVRLLFTCLEVGKEIGAVVETDPVSETASLHQSDVITLSVDWLAQIIDSADEALRLSGLSLMITSPSATKPFSPRALQYFVSSLSRLFMETDLYVRGEIFVCLQHLVDRVKAASGPLHRLIAKSRGGQMKSSTLAEHDTVKVFSTHRTFMDSLVNLAQAQLHPCAAYQRHISGLKCLHIIAKSGLDKRLPIDHYSKQAAAKEAPQWPFSLTVFTEELSRMLMDLLMDPFEDVRTSAASLLVMQCSITSFRDGDDWTRLLKRAEGTMLASGRADHADGLSRANAIVFAASDHLRHGHGQIIIEKVDLLNPLVSRLESRLKLAGNDLTLAVSSYPLHGVLSSVRLMLDTPHFYAGLTESRAAQYADVHLRLLKCLNDVWTCVKSVLSNDAPEGYMPEDIDGAVDVSTKDVLSFCWRALKEASSLVRVIVSNASIGDEQHQLVSTEDFQQVFDLTFIELVELRHRGAFSAVAQAFSACCSRAAALQSYNLLENMYHRTMDTLKANGSVITRRSAGIPSLIVGILCASPSGPLFKTAVNDLFLESDPATGSVAVHGDSLPQVHALNCLRSIFTNNVLGPFSEPYIADALSLSGKCLTSDVWAIRNCGLMLFRSLIDRLLGSTEAQSSATSNGMAAKSRFTYSNFPNLLDMVITLLSPTESRLGSAQNALESVFPALKMIQRMPPPASHLQHILELVLRLSRSPHWHVRDMAARTIVVLVDDHQTVEFMVKCVPQAGASQNLIHGRLLCISHLLEDRQYRRPLDVADIQQLGNALSTAKEFLDTTKGCSFTQALYLDIVSELETIQLKYRVSNDLHPAVLAHNDTSTALKSAVATADLEGHLHNLTTTPANVRKSKALYISLHYLTILRRDASEENLKADMQLFLQYLSELDSKAFIDTLDRIVQISKHLSDTAIATVAEVLGASSTHDAGRNAHTLSATRLLLVQLYGALADRGYNLHDCLTTEDMRLSLSSMIPPPSLVESTVQLWGLLLNRELQNEVLALRTLQDAQYLAHLVRSLIEERQTFDLRIAAARCVANIPFIWHMQTTDASLHTDLEAIRLDFMLVLYDLLNDDDDEIRDLATTITYSVLANQSSIQIPRPVVPLRSSQLLLHFILHAFKTQQTLSASAIERTTGTTDQTSAKPAFNAACETNTALFAVEKQNLFIDPVREAILWSQVLKHLISENVVSSENMRRLIAWAREGLRLIRDRMKTHEDGVLGWSSRPEMFLFGMKVWCAVDVVLVWQRRVERMQKMTRKTIAGLVEILALAKETKVHPLWIGKLERVVVRNIRMGMRDGSAGKNMRAMMAVAWRE